MRKILLVISVLIIMSYAAIASAVPQIGGAPGSVSNGQNITLTGNGFGNHNLDVEWLGGPTGNIELGDNGSPFVKTKWRIDTESSSRSATRYSSERAHSGSKSIVSAFPIESQYTSGFSYNHGTQFNSIYISYWSYFDHVNSGGQWKKWRLRPSDGYGDTNGEIMTSDWHTAAGGSYQNYTLLFCDYRNYAQCYPGGISEVYGNSEDMQPIDRWVRVEIFAEGSSVDGQNDGTLIYSMDTQNKTTHLIRNYQGTITTRLPGSEKWQSFVFENYWGNIDAVAPVVGNGTGEKIYTDDIYIQIGTRARVELGNKEHWMDCTHREIQYPTSWSNSSITVNVNQGSFQSGETAYLFVVDENGNASEGQLITIDGGGGTTTTIAPPDNVSIVTNPEG